MDERCVAAEAGEAEAGVLAEESVGVVFAHGGRLVGVDAVECVVEGLKVWRIGVGGTAV